MKFFQIWYIEDSGFADYEFVVKKFVLSGSRWKTTGSFRKIG